MKKTKASKGSTGSGGSTAIWDTVKLMEKSLTDWNSSLGGGRLAETARHLDQFIVAAREGYRLIAAREGLGEDDANDVAQICALKLTERAATVTKHPFSGAKVPFVPSKISALRAETPVEVPKALAGSSSSAKKSAGLGSPLAAYLYGVLYNGARAQARSIRTKARRLVAIENENSPSGESGKAEINVPQFASVINAVSLAQNLPTVSRIHDDYIDSVTHRGTSLRIIFGDWTPLGEWMGRCEKNDRPPAKVMPPSTLRNHIRKIKERVREAKSNTVKSQDQETDPWDLPYTEEEDV